MFENAKINWRKYGLVIKPDKKLWWAQSHAMVPTPELLENGLVKIYFSGRDTHNRSHIGYAIIDLHHPDKVIEYSAEPILKPGELGCFDDNGVTPSCLVTVNNKKHLYYIGWNPGSTVRMHIFGGLAISDDNGDTFERWSRAPIIERIRVDPFINTAPWVVPVDDKWRMYYVSGVVWLNKDMPRYHIKLGFSDDAKNWKRDGHICIDFKNDNEMALARPYVIYEEKIWKMWFSYKVGSYRVGYAESEDGINWHRRDEYSGIDVSENSFDSDMIEYSSVIKYKDQHFMFYNGNNFGYDGIGMAVQE